jgi:hypothetical protein
MILTLTPKQVKEVQELLLHIDVEIDRMSDDGEKAFDKLCAMFNVQ